MTCLLLISSGRLAPTLSVKCGGTSRNLESTRGRQLIATETVLPAAKDKQTACLLSLQRVKNSAEDAQTDWRLHVAESHKTAAHVQ